MVVCLKFFSVYGFVYLIHFLILSGTLRFSSASILTFQPLREILCTNLRNAYVNVIESFQWSSSISENGNNGYGMINIGQLRSDESILIDSNTNRKRKLQGSDGIIKKNNLVDSIVESNKDLKESIEITSNAENKKPFRAATGGIVHTVMIILTIVAFIGNGLFMVYVFWIVK